MLHKVVRRFFYRDWARIQNPIFKPNPESLAKVGIKCPFICRNLSYAELYEKSWQGTYPSDPETRCTVIGSSGAMIAYSGARTGRSPNDKRTVYDAKTKDEIWWGKVNVPIEPESFAMLESLAINYLNNRNRLYIVDGYAGWDPKFRKKFRIFCTRSYHALFMKNMLIEPTEEELIHDFDKGADFHIFNAGELQAPKTNLIKGLDPKSGCSISVNLTDNKMVILGTQYAGEMKKGIFSIMNYLMPKAGVVSLHASANEGTEKGDVTVLFGLSGTGKTTLSTDPKRKLIGDDEHCWSNDGIFNIEGGCYAKCINLRQEKEPDIYNALKFGACLENVEFKDAYTREVDFDNGSITENTRASYPLQYIQGAKIPAVGGHPSNIIFLTCDSFGVLPPIAKLTPEQAMYHFISGYTAKVAGTEVGIVEPVSTFSACFGSVFLPLHPTIYAEMLAEKMKKYNVKAWLMNTGWSGGKYGVGKRMDINVSRSLIDGIHSGALDNSYYENFPVFNLQIPKSCPKIDPKILNPKNTWNDKKAYDQTLNKLAKDFNDNFKIYAERASQAIKDAGPKVQA